MIKNAQKGTGDVWPPHELGQHPNVMDPMERKNVYVGASTQPFADEGLFARFAGFDHGYQDGYSHYNLDSGGTSEPETWCHISQARGRCQTSCFMTT